MGTQKNKEKLVLLLGLVIILLVAGNSVVWFARFDLTQNRAYTISDQTIKYLKSLDEPVRITYYVSPAILGKLPQIKNIADLVEEFAYSSDGKVQVRIRQVDSEKDKAELQGKGIQSQQYQVVQENEMSVEMVYSGIQIEYLNHSKVIPFIADPATLEYQITLVIRGVVNNHLPVAGILVGKPDYDPGSQLNLLKRFFAENYSLRMLRSQDVIPPDVDFLVVLGDETLTETDAVNIDSYLMGGKKALIALDTIGVDIGQSLEPRPTTNSPVRKLVKNYGVDVKTGWVLDLQTAKLPVQKNVQGVTYELQEPYAPWVHAGSSQLNQSNILTQHVPFIDLLWASPLELLGDNKKTQVLISSSPDSFILDNPSNADPYVLKAMVQDKNQDRRSWPLAVLVEGTLTSPYKMNGQAKASQDMSSIVVVGDSDFLSDLLQVSQSTGNMDFIRNVFEWMGYDTDIMALRNREIQNARLDRISDKSTRNLVITLAQVVNIGIIPAVVVIIGVIRLVRRKRKAADSLRTANDEK